MELGRASSFFKVQTHVLVLCLHTGLMWSAVVIWERSSLFVFYFIESRAINTLCLELEIVVDGLEDDPKDSLRDNRNHGVVYPCYEENTEVMILVKN